MNLEKPAKIFFVTIATAASLVVWMYAGILASEYIIGMPCTWENHRGSSAAGVLAGLVVQFCAWATTW